MANTAGRPEAERRSRPYMKAIVIGILVVFTLGTILIYFTSERQDVVAVVNGQKILKKRVVDELTQRHGRDLLDELIEDMLVEQQAKKVGVTVEAERVDSELGRIQSQFGSDQEFQMVLAQYGMTEDDLRRKLRFDLLLEAIVIKEYELDVTDEEAREFYEDSLYMFQTGEYANARHILVDTEEAALDIIEALNEGADFGELAAEHSIDPASAEEGGSVVVHRGQMVAEFEEAVFDLPEGVVSGPVQSMYGFHVIRVDQHFPAVTSPFEQVEETVRTRALSNKARDLSWDWLDKVRQDSKIEYRVNW